MVITGLWLQDFRSFSNALWKLGTGLNVIVAANGSGKSNLIESISLLATGDSWRASKVDELITWDSELARLKARVELEDGEILELEQILTRGIVQGKRSAKKIYRVNGVGRRAAEALHQLAVVLFTPEDMEVFQGGPDGRRRLLDQVLSQVFPSYRQSLKTYQQALRRRNRLILQLRDGHSTRYDFFSWDQLIIKHGEILHTHRQDFLHWLETQAGPREAYRVVYDHSIVSEARLHQYAQAEVGAGYTLVGPHRDDWQIEVQRGGTWRDLERFGSRGEQRLALVWWKLAELQFLEQHRQVRPILMLDDVFSELDPMNRALLLNASVGRQCIITTTDEPEIIPALREQTTFVPLVGILES